MTIILPRRSFLLGLGAALAAPAIVRASSLMPVRTPRLDTRDARWNVVMHGDTMHFTHEWFDGRGKLIATSEGPVLKVPFTMIPGNSYTVHTHISHQNQEMHYEVFIR